MDFRAERLVRLAYAAAFALSYALAFPFRAGELRFDLGLAMGWLALVPFAHMIRGLAPRAAFAWGSAAGTAAFSGILFWIYVVITEHGGGAAPLGVAGVLALSLYCALHLGLAAALCAALEPRAGRLAVLVLPAAWVVAEHLRSFDLASGFPWAYLGYSVHLDGPVRQLASLGGVFGLSFLQASFASLLSRRRLVLAFALLALAHAAGFALGISQLGGATAQAGLEPLRAGIVQANIPQGEKWDPERAASSFAAHLEGSRLAAEAGSLDLIVWPEASVPVFLELEAEYQQAVSALARETHASLVIGGMGIEIGQGDYRFFNSAFAVTPEGRYVDRYDKAVLVPFGEYIPLRKLLGFLDAVATGLAFEDVTPGGGPRPLSDLPGFGAEHALTSLICYEVIYPELVRRAVQRGARVLLNVTNDAWYGRTSAPHQFLAIAALRSAEHGVPMLRAANTGVSAVVDAGGGVLEETPIFERRALARSIPPAREESTLYTRFGDWVVWGSWALLLAIGARELIGGIRGRGPGDRGRAQGSG